MGENVKTYQEIWKFEHVEQQMNKKFRILLFDVNDKLYQQLVQKNHTVVFILPGKEYKQLSDHEFMIRPNELSDYEEVFRICGKEIDLLLHYWSRGDFCKESLQEQLEMGFLSLEICIKRVVALGRKRPKVCYLYDRQKEKSQPQYEAVSAFLRTISNEIQNLQVQSVGIEQGIESNTIIEQVLYEGNNIDVRYTKEGRKIKRFQEVLVPMEYTNPWLKENGTYVITGGFGGIGLILANEMVKQKKVNLILLGRRAYSDEIADKIKDFQRKGINVRYISADVSDSNKIEQVFMQLKREVPYIDGIFHAAGLTRDRYFLQKKQEEMQQVLSPKVFGTVNLLEAVKTYYPEYEFMVCFSSLAGALGNVGQADYAFANHFMDSLAERKEEKVFAVNWPYWQNGGIRLTEESNQVMEKMYGLQPLASEKAMGVLNSVIHMNVNRLMVFAPVNDSYKKLFINDYQCNEEESGGAIPKLSNEHQMQKKQRTRKSQESKKDGVSMIRKNLMEDIVIIVADILKLRESDVDVDDNLSDYGFDSITFKELSDTMNEKFGTNIMPSIFFEFNTMAEISDYMVEEFQEQVSAYYAEDGEEEIKEVEQVAESDSEVVLPIVEEKVEKKDDILSDAFTFPEVKFDFVEEQVEEKVEEKVESKKVAFTENPPVQSEVYASAPKKEPIAVIGMSGMFPGSDNLDEFWENLVENKDLITEIPSDRWDWRKWYGEPDNEQDKTKVKWGGFMSQVDNFDAPFFGISPREAELMDPQQRLFLQCVYKTIEDAGYAVEDFSDTDTGVFVGVGNFDYLDLYKSSNLPVQAQSATGIAMSMVPSRISFLLNLHGPSEQVDTACSSSLVAIHRAIEAMQNGDCSMSIVGGVNVIASPLMYVAYDKVGMLSRDGKCRSFDEDANGYVRGEGCGSILLKPLSKAIADGDHIYALIKGSAVNHGGRANTLTSPNPNAQASLIQKAWNRAGVSIGTASYIEAHGTGTKLGDPIEINGLKKVFAEEQVDYTSKTCGIATVKANIGHLETAAGIAGVIKTILAMKNGIIPGNPQLKKVNSFIELDQTPLYLLQETKEWKRLKSAAGGEIPRRAGVSSFGFGGVNAHVVLEEYVEEGNKSSVNKKQDYFIPLSADTVEQVKQAASELYDFLSKRFVREDGKKIIRSKRGNALGQLKAIVADILSIDEAQVPISESLSGLGFDQVQLEQFRNKAKDIEGFECIAQILPESDTLEKMAEEMEERVETEEEDSIFPFQDVETITLENIEYTLCQGRSNRKERVLFLVHDIDDLMEKLMRYINGEKAQEVYVGSACEDKVLLNVDAKAKLVLREELLRLGQYEQLAKMYVKGYLVDFKGIDKYPSTKRISLPTYPFRKEKYWFDRFHKVMQENKVIQKTSSCEIKNDTVQRSNPVMTQSSLESKQALLEKMKKAYEMYRGNEVKLEVLDGNIAIISMEDRENSNMFTEELILGLMAKAYEVKQNDDLKVMILKGFDSVFCMGGTKDALMSIHDRKSKCSDQPFIYRGLLDMDIPVITAMQGHASGAGLLFGLYGDIVIMSREGVYSAVFMKYGFTPGMGSTFMLKEKLGGNLAMEMMMTARSFSGEELEKRGAGIIFKDNDKQVMKEAMELARNLAQKPKKSLSVLKKEMSEKVLAHITEAISHEVQMHDVTFSTPEVKERIEDYFIQDVKPVKEEETIEAKLDVSSGQIQLKTLGEVVQSQCVDEKIQLKDVGSEIKEEPVMSDVIKQVQSMSSSSVTSTMTNEEVYENIISILCNSLHIQKKDLNEQLTFKEMGIDSVLGVEIIRDLNRKFDLKLETGIIYSYPTIEQLTSMIQGLLGSTDGDSSSIESKISINEEDFTDMLTKFQDGELSSLEMENYLEGMV